VKRVWGALKHENSIGEETANVIHRFSRIVADDCCGMVGLKQWIIFNKDRVSKLRAKDAAMGAAGKTGLFGNLELVKMQSFVLILCKMKSNLRM
jgi:hypothetical protein